MQRVGRVASSGAGGHSFDVAQGEEESEFAYQTRMNAYRYSSRFPAQFAIELRSGWLEKLDLHVDEKIELDLPRLKARAR